MEDSKYPIGFLTNGTVPLKTPSKVEITNSKFKNNEVNIYFSEETPNLHMNVLVKNNEFTGGRIAGIPNNAIFDSSTFTNTTKRSYAIQYLFNKDTGPANCKLVNNTFNTDYALQYMPYHNHSGAGGATETERKTIAKSELPEMNKNKFKKFAIQVVVYRSDTKELLTFADNIIDVSNNYTKGGIVPTVDFNKTGYNGIYTEPQIKTTPYFTNEEIIQPTNLKIDKITLELDVRDSEYINATVDNQGKVTAVGKGTATITVTATDNKTATCQVTVTEKLAKPEEAVAGTEGKDLIEVTPEADNKTGEVASDKIIDAIDSATVNEAVVIDRLKIKSIIYEIINIHDKVIIQ